MTLIYRGGGGASNDGGGTVISSDPLPAGTLAGDLFITTKAGAGSADLVGGGELLLTMGHGTAGVSIYRIPNPTATVQTSVGGFAGEDFTGGAYAYYVIGAAPILGAIPLVENWPPAGGASEILSGAVSPITALSTIAVSAGKHSVVGGISSTPTPGYVGRAVSGTGTYSTIITSWDAVPAEPPIESSPAATYTMSAGTYANCAYLIAFGRRGLTPPCRVYPRDDQLGSGSARVYPPPRTQQGGRLNGPY